MTTLRVAPDLFNHMFKITGGQEPPLEDQQAAVLAMDYFWNARDLDLVDESELDLVMADGYLDSKAVAAAIERMKAAGMLLPVEEDVARASGDDRRCVAQALLNSIAWRTAAIAGDVSGFRGSAPVFDNDRGAMLIQRLRDIDRELRSLREPLVEARSPYLGEQISALGIDASTRNLKIQLGGGPSAPEDWTNVDFSADVGMNLLWPMPFPNGCAKYVFCSHVLEHFHFRSEALRLLQEMHRIIAPGGAIRIVVPDTELLMRMYVEKRESFFEARKRHWIYQRLSSNLEQVLRYSGAGVRPGDFFRHKWGYDHETLAKLLADAGFVRPRRCAYNETAFPGLCLDDTGASAGLKLDGEYLSLFVEAERA